MTFRSSTAKNLTQSTFAGSLLSTVGWWLLVLSSAGTGTLPAEDAAEPVNPAAPHVRMISVPLPLNGAVEDRVIQAIDQALARLPSEKSARPLLVFEFQPSESSLGEGTEFEAALKLARTITHERLAGVRTLAYLPRSVKGHAVLAAIACEEIILGAEAEFGAAGIDENTITPLLRAGYTEIAEQRRTVPTALALGMLDRAGRLLTVQTLEGSRVIFEHELPALEQSTTVSNVTTLKPEGEFALFTGNKWRHQLGYVSHLASDHEQLAAALKVPVSAFQENPLIGNKIEAVRVNFDGPLNPRLVDRTLKIIGNELKKPEVNLLFLWLRSEGGSLEEALRFARYLRFEIDPSRVRTVVYVSIQARGAAALVALAGDELIMEEGAVLGGEGSATLREKQLEAAIPAVRELFERRDQAWSPALGLMGRPSPVLRYSHAKRPDKQLFSAEEHAARADRIDWSAEVQPVELARGISSQDAVEYGLATHRTRRFEEVKNLYRVERDVHPAKLNWALVFIERLADRRLAGLLLFIGTFALLSELSHPGIGLPGFVASVCFLLFFWSNFLHGNADMLELLLFAAGVACLVVELFVAPGVMIFGIGGVLMIMVSIILASQTFVLPTNTYQLSQVPGSLFMVIGAGAGGLLGLFVLQRYLPHTPYFKKMMLRAPGVDEIDRVHEREKLASFEHLVGKYGETITPLVPSGKIITGDKVIDVVSDGTLIEPGQAVVIVETMGSRVVVRKA